MGGGLYISFLFVGFRFLTLQISLDFVFVSFRFVSQFTGTRKCVGLYRIPECSGFILVNKYFGTINFCRMSENSVDL